MNIVLPPLECSSGRNAKVALNTNESMHNKYKKSQVNLESNSANKLSTLTRNYNVNDNNNDNKTANNIPTHTTNFYNHTTQPANTDLAETGYMHLIRSIRQQFLHPSSTSEPLLLAPQIPSIIRSNIPQTTSFADLINLYKRVHHNVPFQSINAALPNERRVSGVALTQSGNQLAAPRGARKRSVNSVLAQGEHFIGGNGGSSGGSDGDAFAILSASNNVNYNNNKNNADNNNLCGDGTSKNCKEGENESVNREYELYSAKTVKTLPAIRNASVLDDKIKHSTFYTMTSKVHEINFQPSSKSNGKIGIATKMQPIQPLLQCHTFSDKCLVLIQIESMHRLELIRNEQWERQLAQKYMTVNYIDHILRPEMEELSQMEREDRTELIEQEAFERNANLSSSMEWCFIESGIRALIAKQIKLARLSKYDSQLRKTKKYTYEPHSNNKSEEGVDVHNCANDAVNDNNSRYLTHRASNSVVKTKTECAANSSDENDEVLDARRILERYLHERANYALGRVESIRRLSKLPQLESLSATLASSFNPPQRYNETSHLNEVCSVAVNHINNTKAQSERPPLSSPVSSHTQ